MLLSINLSETIGYTLMICSDLKTCKRHRSRILCKSYLARSKLAAVGLLSAEHGQILPHHLSALDVFFELNVDPIDNIF